MLEENLGVRKLKHGKQCMNWEQMYKKSLDVIQELYREVETLRAIVRVQLPIVGEGNEDL